MEGPAVVGRVCECCFEFSGVVANVGADKAFYLASVAFDGSEEADCRVTDC